MPLASRGEGGTRPPPFNRSRTLGGGERTLALKHQSSPIQKVRRAPPAGIGGEMCLADIVWAAG